MKKALITDVTGQKEAFFSDLLLKNKTMKYMMLIDCLSLAMASEKVYYE